MTDDEQTGAEDAGDEQAADPADEAAAEAARAAADEGADQQIEDVKAGEPPSKAFATPHGHEGDYDPVKEAEKLPEPEPDEAGSDDPSDGPLDL